MKRGRGRAERRLRRKREKRGFIKLNLVSLAFTIAAQRLSYLLALGAVVVVPVALSYLGLQNLTGLLFRVARWPLLLLIVIFGLAVLYRYGPSPPRAALAVALASAAPSQRSPLAHKLGITIVVSR